MYEGDDVGPAITTRDLEEERLHVKCSITCHFLLSLAYHVGHIDFILWEFQELNIFLGGTTHCCLPYHQPDKVINIKVSKAEKC